MNVRTPRDSVLGLIIALVLATAAGCTRRASKSDAEAAVRRSLPDQGVPRDLLDEVPGTDYYDYARCTQGNNVFMKELRTIEVRDITVIEIEEPWKDTTSWPYVMNYPAKVSIDGVCTEGGKRLRFHGVEHVYLTPHDDGSWTAHWIK